MDEPTGTGDVSSREGWGSTPWHACRVPAELDGRTVEGVLRRWLGLSRGLVRRLKAQRAVFLNGQPVPVTRRVKGGDRLELYGDRAPSSAVVPEYLPLDIVYEDSHLLVVDKPAGVVVHPARSYTSGTLANGVAYHLLQQGLPPAVRLLNRLDKGTSGLLAIAKTPLAHQRMTRQLLEGGIRREYLAVVQGRVEADQGTLAFPIRRVAGHPVKREVAPDGQPALTHFQVKHRWKDASLLALRLETGRTHQIRVHLAHAGHPLIGDDLYGSGPAALMPRPALHAFRLRLRHPASGNPVAFESPLPEDMARLVQALAAALEVRSIHRHPPFAHRRETAEDTPERPERTRQTPS